MRVITDPIVDSVVFLITRFLLPPLLRMVNIMASLSFRSGLYLTAKIFGQHTADKSSQFSAEMVCYRIFPSLFKSELILSKHHHIVKLIETSWDEVLPWPSYESNLPNMDTNKSQGAEGILEALADLAEPYFATLGGKVRVDAARLETTWKRLALGHGATERAFAVFLGYAVVGFLLAVYLNILTVGNVKSAGRAVRNAVRQQLLIVKVSLSFQY